MSDFGASAAADRTAHEPSRASPSRPSGEHPLRKGLRFKTQSEQRLEWLESLKRPLSPHESDELRRALHAVYCRNRKLEAA